MAFWQRKDSNPVDWERTIDDLGTRLYRYFCSRCQEMDAADLTQETLGRLFRKVEDKHFDSSKGNLAMLSFGIARFVALEFRQDQKKTPWRESSDPHSPESALSLEIRDESFDLEEIFAQTERKVILRKAILQLSEMEQEIICLMIDEDIGPSEIAKILDQAEGTVKSHIHRAKARLGQILTQQIKSL